MHDGGNSLFPALLSRVIRGKGADRFRRTRPVRIPGILKHVLFKRSVAYKADHKMRNGRKSWDNNKCINLHIYRIAVSGRRVLRGPVLQQLQQRVYAIGLN